MADLPIVEEVEEEFGALDREFRITLPRLIREARRRGYGRQRRVPRAKQRQECVGARPRAAQAAALRGWAMVNVSSIPRTAGFAAR